MMMLSVSLYLLLLLLLPLLACSSSIVLLWSGESLTQGYSQMFFFSADFELMHVFLLFSFSVFFFFGQLSCKGVAD